MPPVETKTKPTNKVVAAAKAVVKKAKELPPKVGVRFDANADSWAVVDEKDGRPIRHFSHGVMVNAEFRTVSITEVVGVGCGSETRNGTAGFAYGNLYENTHGKDMQGWKNLGFKGDGFLNEDGQRLESARKLRLMPGRRALYKL